MGIVAPNYLTLQLVRLQGSEEWTNCGEGLSFILPTGGAGKCFSGEKIHHLARGDLLVWDSATGGKQFAASGEMVFWSFSVCFDHLLPLFAAGEICLLQEVTENFKGFRLYSAASPLAQECHKLVESAPPEGNVDHRSQVLRIAAAFLAVEFQKTRTHQPGFVSIEDHMVQVFRGLSADELLTLSVGDLAGRFSCSRRHLNRLFHLHLGFSAAALRMEMRLLKAVSLLRNPNLKVSSVAHQCRFNHLGLFNTCFKRRFGSSPGQWRKTGLQNGGQSSVTFDGSLPDRVAASILRPAPRAIDLNGLIRAKVYETLKGSQPWDLPDPASQGASDTNRFNALPKRNGQPSTAARYRSPP